jgi:hypothetical protein
VKYINNEFVVVTKNYIIDPKEKLYKIYDSHKKDPTPPTLVEKTKDWSRI